MKRCFSILLCFSLLSFMAVPAFASEAEPDYIAEYEAQYGKMPVASDYSSDAEYQAAYDVWLAGFVPYVDMRSAEWSRQKAEAEEAVRIAGEESSSQEAAEDESPVSPPKIAESVGVNDEADTSVSVSPGSADKYPVGSYIDPAGNVYSPDGTLLSPGTTPAMDPTDSLSPAVGVQDALDLSETVLSEDKEPVYYLSDLRADDDPAAPAPVGLKALVISIFGEYTPVTTTSVVGETVGNEVNQYLVETVAPGAAGVDYEWIAGVFLFGILLFCLMKLLGGIVK